MSLFSTNDNITTTWLMIDILSDHVSTKKKGVGSLGIRQQSADSYMGLTPMSRGVIEPYLTG